MNSVDQFDQFSQFNLAKLSPQFDENNNSQCKVIPDTQGSPNNLENTNLAASSDKYINHVNSEIAELKASLDSHRSLKSRIVADKKEAMQAIMNVIFFNYKFIFKKFVFIIVFISWLFNVGKFVLNVMLLRIHMTGLSKIWIN